MILYETTFSFKDVLQLQPGGDNTVSHELVDQAWLQWASRAPAVYVKYDEVAQATVEIGPTGYIVIIEAEETP